ncbi:MAG TPA: hypothetical protein VJP77_08375, partial [Planctomycetota bacterium]|nr:hypothetical protein [Planctomycetota bacterium]
MHGIERYGLISLLFLVVSAVAVTLWDDGESPEPTRVARVEPPAAHRDTPTLSQRNTPALSR